MGFKGVEIFENDFLVHDLKPKEIQKIVSDYGLEISLFQPFRDFEGMPCLLYTSPSPRDRTRSRMPSSA